MFGKTKCKQCGTVLEVTQTVKNSGSVFCSDNCATAYVKKSKDEHGCCC